MKDLLFDYSGTGRLLTNVVFMGQGEPVCTKPRKKRKKLEKKTERER